MPLLLVSPSRVISSIGGDEERLEVDSAGEENRVSKLDVNTASSNELVSFLNVNTGTDEDVDIIGVVLLGVVCDGG